jgi:hypothetical protein
VRLVRSPGPRIARSDALTDPLPAGLQSGVLRLRSRRRRVPHVAFTNNLAAAVALPHRAADPWWERGARPLGKHSRTTQASAGKNLACPGTSNGTAMAVDGLGRARAWPRKNLACSGTSRNRADRAA